MHSKQAIVTIGGGTGTPVLNQALLSDGINYINSIVTVMDSGGITGRMRTDARGMEIAYSDGLRTLLSLLPPKETNSQRVLALRELLRRRNPWGEDLGYTIFSHYFSEKNGFTEIQKLLENLTGINFLGRIIPVTLSSTQLCFRTVSGQDYKGEHELDDKRMSADMVEKIWLSPEVSASPQAVSAIKNARIIFFSCGSLHGSILVNLLPEGIKEALKKTDAKKVLLTNLASTRNETDNFKPADFIRLFKKYTGLPRPLDAIIVPELSRLQFERRYPNVAKRYALEQSYFLGWEESDLTSVRKSGVAVIKHTATTIDPKLERIRHDPEKLAPLLESYTKLV